MQVTNHQRQGAHLECLATFLFLEICFLLGMLTCHASKTQKNRLSSQCSCGITNKLSQTQQSLLPGQFWSSRICNVFSVCKVKFASYFDLQCSVCLSWHCFSVALISELSLSVRQLPVGTEYSEGQKRLQRCCVSDTCMDENCVFFCFRGKAHARNAFETLVVGTFLVFSMSAGHSLAF